MPPKPSRAALGLALLLLCGASPSAQGSGSLRAAVEARLGESSLDMGLSVGRGSSHLGLGLETEGEGRELRACLSLGSPDEGGAGFLAGRGSASGPARLLVDPTSPTALALGPPVELDSSLESKTSVAGLAAGPLSLFALKPGGAGPEEGAAGLCLSRVAGEAGLGAIGAVCFEGRPAEPGGWAPDPSASPLARAADRDRPCLAGALLAQRRSGGSWALAALAASTGRVAGRGLALRLEAGELLGPVQLRLCAGTAGPGFRELAGARSYRRLQALAEARLALRRATALSASVETEAQGESLLYSPLWGRKAALRLLLPVGVAGLVDSRVEARSPCAGSRSGSWSLSLQRRSREGRGPLAYSSLVRADCALSWESGFSGLACGLETELSGEGACPLLGLELGLGLFEGGDRSSPALATGALRLRLPLGRDASLEVAASLPAKGLALVPAPEGSRRSSPQFSLRYRASVVEPPPSSSPRSRMSVLP
jgi:hypothetical protein